jgi:hypothetical protein
MDVADAACSGSMHSAYVLLVYGGGALSRRILWFPLVQQALQVLPLLLWCRRYRPMRLAVGADFPGWAISSVRCVATLLWPVLTFILFCRSTSRSTRMPTARSETGPTVVRGHWRPIRLKPIVDRFRFRLDRELERFRFRVGSAGPVLSSPSSCCFAASSGCRSSARLLPTRAEDNRIALVPIVPNRGVIVDRNGGVLARNYSAFTLEITPSQGRRSRSHHRHAWQIDRSPAQGPQALQAACSMSRRTSSRLPIRSPDRRGSGTLCRQSLSFSRRRGQSRLFRQYPAGRGRFPCLGYIGRINRPRPRNHRGRRSRRTNYKGTDHIGKSGLEQKYEFELHGETGYEEVEIDAGGRAVRSCRAPRRCRATT